MDVEGAVVVGTLALHVLLRAVVDCTIVLRRVDRSRALTSVGGPGVTAAVACLVRCRVRLIVVITGQVYVALKLGNIVGVLLCADVRVVT